MSTPQERATRIRAQENLDARSNTHCVWVKAHGKVALLPADENDWPFEVGEIVGAYNGKVCRGGMFGEIVERPADRNLEPESEESLMATETELALLQTFTGDKP